MRNRHRNESKEPPLPIIPPEIVKPSQVEKIPQKAEKIVPPIPVVQKEVVKKQIVLKETVIEIPKDTRSLKVLKKETIKKVLPPEPEKVSKKESEFYGIGIIGSNPDINMFKGLCKIKHLTLGEELVKMIKVFNEKNKL